MNKNKVKYFEYLLQKWEDRIAELQSYKEPEPYYRSEEEVLREIIIQVSCRLYCKK